jgi:transcriptional regulator with XRE-family HTH domain
MIIRRVSVNNSKKSLEITTEKGEFSLPFSSLDLLPKPGNKIKDIYVDKELGGRAVTYIMESGEEDSVHLDEFLDYNKEPHYAHELTLYKLSLRAIELVEKSPLSKRELARKLKTSPSHLYRLLNTANYSKTVDQMIKLLAALDYEVDFTIRETSTPKSKNLRTKFPHLSEKELKELPRSSKFKTLTGEYKKAA